MTLTRILDHKYKYNIKKIFLRTEWAWDFYNAYDISHTYVDVMPDIYSLSDRYECEIVLHTDRDEMETVLVFYNCKKLSFVFNMILLDWEGK